MKLRNTLIIICCGIVLFTACKKTEDKNDNNPTPTTKQLLLAGKWQEIAETATVTYMGKDTIIDLYKDMEDCEKDDFMTFGDDGITTKNENTNVCTGKPQTIGFPYALLNNDTKLALIDSNPDTFDVEINSSQIKLKKITKTSSGYPETWLVTLKNIK